MRCEHFHLKGTLVHGQATLFTDLQQRIGTMAGRPKTALRRIATESLVTFHFLRIQNQHHFSGQIPAAR